MAIISAVRGIAYVKPILPINALTSSVITNGKLIIRSDGSPLSVANVIKSGSELPAYARINVFDIAPMISLPTVIP